MAAVSPDIAGFSRLIDALDSWLDHVVIVGGWAHRLYHLHPVAQKVDFAPLVTLDTDVALPTALPPQTPTIRDALAAHGFEERFAGEDMPPATRYQLGDSNCAFYAEFLTPLTGSAHTRSGKRKATVQIAGVNTQQLRFIELLLRDPWAVQLSADDFGLRAAKSVRVANPVGFLAQKLLIHRKRSVADQAKDILYLHDTLQVFGARLRDLRTEWIDTVRPSLHSNAISKIASTPSWLFGSNTDAVRKAAAMAADRRMSAEGMREACLYGLRQLGLTREAPGRVTL